MDRQKALRALREAETKAWSSLKGYKFYMFGYWAARWVQINKDWKFGEPNPFRVFVEQAKDMAHRRARR